MPFQTLAWLTAFSWDNNCPAVCTRNALLYFPFVRQHLRREHTDASSQAVTAFSISPGKILPRNDAYIPEDKHREVLGKTGWSGMSLVLSCSRRQCSWGPKQSQMVPTKWKDRDEHMGKWLELQEEVWDKREPHGSQQRGFFSCKGSAEWWLTVHTKTLPKAGERITKWSRRNKSWDTDRVRNVPAAQWENLSGETKDELECWRFLAVDQIGPRLLPALLLASKS